MYADYVHGYNDRLHKPRHYYKREGCRAVRVPGLPWSPDFMAAYQTWSHHTLNTKRGGFAGFVYREREQAGDRRRRRTGHGRRMRDRARRRPVVATTRSSFGLAEVKRNLIAGAGGLFRLPRAIGRGRGDGGHPHRRAAVAAQRAYDLGLVNRLVEPGQAVDEATKLAEQICAAAPLAVRASRKVVLAVGLRGRRDAEEDDQRELRRDHGLRGHQGRSHRVHREAGAELAGQVAARAASRR